MPTETPSPTPVATPTPAQKSAGSDLPPNVAAALSYLFGFISGIVFLLISKDKNVRFHAWQSTITSLALVVLNFVLGFIPFLGLMLIPLVSLGSLILFIVLIVKAYQGEKFKLPIVGDIAESKA